jgi:hypothetical protein
MPDRERNNAWRITKEKILMFSGLLLIGFEAVVSEIYMGAFHLEFLLAGLALCGVSIAQWGDRK